MGTIRVLLAFAVIFSHTGSHVLVGGEAALQCFYLISGFLISYILQNTAAYGDLRNFYLNRFLRIYPMYWAVALLTVMFYLLAFALGIDHKLQTLLSLPLSAQVTLMTTNIVLFGQDVIMFLGLRENGLAFFLDYHASSPQLWTFLLVPQAWSLSVELTFYLCAPFILKNRNLLYTCLALSLIARGAAMVSGFGLADPWSYRFFPFELSLFLFGALAHQILLPRVERLCDAVPRLETIAVAALLAMIVALPMPAGDGYLLKKCCSFAGVRAGASFPVPIPEALFVGPDHRRVELSSLYLPLVHDSHSQIWAENGPSGVAGGTVLLIERHRHVADLLRGSQRLCRRARGPAYEKRSETVQNKKRMPGSWTN